MTKDVAVKVKKMVVDHLGVEEEKVTEELVNKSKSENEIILIFNEIIKEIRKIELKKKIEKLEDKVSLNLNESLYSELLSLRNQLKEG